MKILQQAGCEIMGKWTPSHQNIFGNKHADKLAKAESKKPACTWSRTTLSWLRAHAYHTMIDKWKTEHPGVKPRPKPFQGTSKLSWRSASAIARGQERRQDLAAAGSWGCDEGSRRLLRVHSVKTLKKGEFGVKVCAGLQSGLVLTDLFDKVLQGLEIDT